jgi:hypothetical protein
VSIEVEGLGTFEKKLLSIATEKLPKQSLQIVRKMGSKARTLTAKNARTKVNKYTGYYSKHWERGKAFRNGNTYAVYVKNSSPHAHLIENGHRIIDKNGKEHGFKEGKHILEDSMKEFENTQMEKMLDDWLDDLLEDGLL